MPDVPTPSYDGPPAEAREVAAGAYHQTLPSTYGGGLPVPCSGDHDGIGCSAADTVLAAIWVWLAEGTEDLPRCDLVGSGQGVQCDKPKGHTGPHAGSARFVWTEGYPG